MIDSAIPPTYDSPFSWDCPSCQSKNVGSGSTYPTNCAGCGAYWMDVRATVSNGQMVLLVDQEIIKQRQQKAFQREVDTVIFTTLLLTLACAILVTILGLVT